MLGRQEEGRGEAVPLLPHADVHLPQRQCQLLHLSSVEPRVQVQGTMVTCMYVAERGGGGFK